MKIKRKIPEWDLTYFEEHRVALKQSEYLNQRVIDVTLELKEKTKQYEEAVLARHIAEDEFCNRNEYQEQQLIYKGRLEGVLDCLDIYEDLLHNRELDTTVIYNRMVKRMTDLREKLNDMD